MQAQAVPEARRGNAAASTTAAWLGTGSRWCPLKRGALPRLHAKPPLTALAWIPAPALLLHVLPS